MCCPPRSESQQVLNCPLNNIVQERYLFTVEHDGGKDDDRHGQGEHEETQFRGTGLKDHV